MDSEDLSATETSQNSPHHGSHRHVKALDAWAVAGTTTLDGTDPESIILEDVPPDGGTWAWLCVLGTHLVVMNTWGAINSFGVFQGYYVENLGRTPSDISWIGSIEIFLLFFVGSLAGRLSDAGYFRHIILFGSALIVIGTLTTSVCDQYWQVILAQGGCVGLGNGLVFCPSVAVTSTYFKKRRALTIGITACGSSTGGIIYPLVARQLLPRIGFGWTTRTIGLLQALGLLVAYLCLRPRLQPHQKAEPLVDWGAFRESDFICYGMASFLFYWGTYLAFFYVAAYSRDVQGVSYVDSLNVLLILNGVGLVGRLLPNHLADHFGTLTIFVPTIALSAILVYCWIAVSSTPGLYVWAAVSGIPLGGIQSLFPSALASLTADPRKQGTRMGMMLTIVSFGVLTGPPIEGALISRMQGEYRGAQLFAGSSLMIGSVLMLLTRELKRKRLGMNIWAKV